MKIVLSKNQFIQEKISSRSWKVPEAIAKKNRIKDGCQLNYSIIDIESKIEVNGVGAVSSGRELYIQHQNFELLDSLNGPFVVKVKKI
jgi:hypothetical protein